GFVQAVERFAPESLVDQVVPFRDQVVDGAARGHAFEQGAGVAEGNAAIHATGALLLQHRLGGVRVEFAPVADALGGRFRQRQLALAVHEPGGLAHKRPRQTSSYGAPPESIAQSLTTVRRSSSTRIVQSRLEARLPRVP